MNMLFWSFQANTFQMMETLGAFERRALLALRSIIFPRIYTYLLERRDPRVSKLILENSYIYRVIRVHTKNICNIDWSKNPQGKTTETIEKRLKLLLLLNRYFKYRNLQKFFFILVLLFLEMSSIRYYVHSNFDITNLDIVNFAIY